MIFELGKGRKQGQDRGYDASQRMRISEQKNLIWSASNHLVELIAEASIYPISLLHTLSL